MLGDLGARAMARDESGDPARSRELAQQWASAGYAAEATDRALELSDRRTDLLIALAARMDAQFARARSGRDAARDEARRWSEMMLRRPGANRSVHVREVRAEVMAGL